MNSIIRKFLTSALTASVLWMPDPVFGESPSPGTAKAYLVADAHLDTQWNWDVQTTISRYVRNTLDQNLALLQKYPGYIFNFEGGVKYAWMKEYYPREYEMMKPYVKADRWHISGASWDATDAIVPSPESAIRNILLGQQFYRDEFGVESTDIFLPDCFGFGWTLPTIASHCGLIGFSSQKLGWRHRPFHGDRKYPFTLGVWRGVDGSEIMMAHGWGYGQRWGHEDLTRSEELGRNISESPLGVAMRYYGTGDIGGSPTITSVDAVQRALAAEGPVKVVSAQSDLVFKDFKPYTTREGFPRYDGELLMDVHGTGCYTSQAAMKLYNRQNELLGDAAERASVAAELLGCLDYPSGLLTDAWRRFIFHQFHDDLTGTSIPRAYEFSWNDELLSLKQFSNTVTSAVGAVASRLDTRTKGVPVIMYNPLGYEVEDIVRISVPAAMQAASIEVYNPQGDLVPVQKLPYGDGCVNLLARVAVPANGMAVYDVRVVGSAKEKQVETPASVIENSVYRLQLDGAGDITSLYDKSAGRELVRPGGKIRLALFEDNKSYDWPAWEVIKSTLDAAPVSVDGDVRMTLVEDGPLRKTLRVTKSSGDSRYTQYIRLYEGPTASRIDFDNEIDWRSLNSLLKAEFQLAVSSPEATYDLGIGSVRRGNNTDIAYEVPAQQWADLTDADGSYGVTLMNDCKYGWDKPDDNTLRLTLLHTPSTDRNYVYQDHQDLGHHEFTYSLMGHSGALRTSDASRESGRLNQRVKPFVVDRHKGDLGKSYSIASVDNDNMMIKALKKAEKGDWYVVRLYETAGADQKGKLTFNSCILEAYEADGTEKSLGSVKFKGNSLPVSVNANGLRTYKVRLAKSDKAPANSLTLPLEYDRKCFTWNHFSGDGDFDGSYSYAAELVPSTLVSGGVPFELENDALLNGMTCRGNKLTLPAGHKFNRLYLLAASTLDNGGSVGKVTVGKKTVDVIVPSYTGFIGQWGHEGHTDGYLYDTDVAWAGTHRHSPEGDHPYEFTYMFRIPVDLSEGTQEITLPDNKDIVIFAATAFDESGRDAKPASPLFRTSNVGGLTAPVTDKKEEGRNILRPEHIVASSGFVRKGEHPQLLVDGDETTKWCDAGGRPSFVEFDLGEPVAFSSWKMVNAASENPDYVTGSWLIQARNTPGEDWRTIECLTSNRRNVVSGRLSESETARYVRLFVIQPTQSESPITRIYEFGLYE